MADTRRALVALSGGVDSSVAAALLISQGFEVEGVYMRLWAGERQGNSCSTADGAAAQAAAEHLGIRLHQVDWSRQFNEQVIDPFVEAASNGHILNPCLSCNRKFKIEGLYALADELGIEWVATGHYARVVGHAGRAYLGRAADAHKDQSYVLYMMPRHLLERTLFPNGGMDKAQVRELAGLLRLPAATVPDSMDLCFDAAGEARRRIPLRTGTVRDTSGRLIGHLPDMELVAIGQRRGLPARPAGQPNLRSYVVAKDATTGTITIGYDNEARIGSIGLDQCSWSGEPPCVGQEIAIQCSAHGRAVPGRVVMSEDGLLDVELDSPTRPQSPGQAGVVYVGDRVLGGGIIKS